MKTGKSVSELANEIVRQHNAKRDFIVPDQKINVYTNTDLLELGFQLNGSDLFGGPLTENGHDQLGNITGIPARYYDLMRSNSAELLATNVRYWLEKSSDRRMIRTLDGNIRALLSDKYRRLDNVTTGLPTWKRSVLK